MTNILSGSAAIANVFFRCGYIEAWGRGIEKICRECDQSGNSYPIFDISDCGFMVRFDALKSALIDNVAQNDTQGDTQGDTQDVLQDVPQDVPQDVSQDVPRELTEIQQKIFRCIKNDPKISREKIAKIIGVSQKTVARNLAGMKNYIQFIGRGYSGHWEIVFPMDSKQ
ncbi:MAG: winged helix-turn-helix transcriptional regulator [Lentisphaeria bacterium]|nr:winged helix-turn-helix transcriptional regulator [Lentisphaeria bacterium]